MAQSSFDRRRINGPEESFPPVFEDEIKALPHRFSGKARNGRSSEDIRPIFLQPGFIGSANGSAYIETEKIKLACAVYGPRQSKNTAYSEKGRLNVEVKFAPFSCTRRKAPLRDAEDRSMAVSVQQALTPSIRLELLPKSTIDVFIVIIENDGVEGCIASASTVASVALANAGIEMLGLVTSCAAAVFGGEIWLDPTEEEAQASDGSVVLACLPALGNITNIWQSGQMKADEAIKCMQLCQERCIDIHSIVAQSLLENNKTGDIP